MLERMSFLLFFFMLSCAPGGNLVQDASEMNLDNHDSPMETDTLEVPAFNGSPEISPEAGLCTAGWTCFSSTQKIYRHDNCSLGRRETCKFGCTNDGCAPAPICTSGFKCKGTSVRGYQLEDCSWTSEARCDYGCQDATCLDKPNITLSTEQGTGRDSQSSSPPPTYPELIQGQSVPVESEGTTFILSIYALDAEQVKVALDSRKSDWLSQGEMYRFNSAGVTINIREILFQPHEGGKRAITYEIQ